MILMMMMIWWCDDSKPRDDVMKSLQFLQGGLSIETTAALSTPQSASQSVLGDGWPSLLIAPPPPPPTPVTTWRWYQQPCCSALWQPARLQLTRQEGRSRRWPTWAASPSRTAASSVSVGLSLPRSSWKVPDQKLVLVQAIAISLPSTSSAINLRGKTISYISQRSGGRNLN